MESEIQRRKEHLNEATNFEQARGFVRTCFKSVNFNPNNDPCAEPSSEEDEEDDAQDQDEKRDLVRDIGSTSSRGMDS